MNRDSAYAAFSSFIAEERPNAEQSHFINQVVDYVVENGYVKDILDLMKAPFDRRPFKFSMIFTRDEQIKFVHVINMFKENAMIASISYLWVKQKRGIRSSPQLYDVL